MAQVPRRSVREILVLAVGYARQDRVFLVRAVEEAVEERTQEPDIGEPAKGVFPHRWWQGNAAAGTGGSAGGNDGPAHGAGR